MGDKGPRQGFVRWHAERIRHRSGLAITQIVLKKAKASGFGYLVFPLRPPADRQTN
jgi:hypothetical protein